MIFTSERSHSNHKRRRTLAGTAFPGSTGRRRDGHPPSSTVARQGRQENPAERM